MARILLSAYACEPDKGSEPAVGWNWALEASSMGHEVWVLTRSNNKESTERRRGCLNGKITFLYFDLSIRVQFCKRRAGRLGVFAYYILWQWFAYLYVRRNFSRSFFHLVHHVTFASIHLPCFMGWLGVPLYLGPLGGGEIVPDNLIKEMGFRERLQETARRYLSYLVSWNPILCAEFKAAARIFVTPTTLPQVPARYRHKCRTRLAIGLTDAEWDQSHSSPSDISRRPPRLLFAGRLLSSKGADIAIWAASELRHSFGDIRLVIAGNGPESARLNKLIQKLNLDQNTEWLGWIPRDKLKYEYRSAHVVVFPAMRDSGGMVALEALSQGTPVVCTDLGGPSVIVTDRCGRVVSSQNKNRSQLAKDFAKAVRDLLHNQAEYAQFSRNAVDRSRQFTFREIVESVYRDLGGCPEHAPRFQ